MSQTEKQTGLWFAITTPKTIPPDPVDLRKSRLLAIVTLVYLVGFSCLFIGYLVLYPNESISPIHLLAFVLMAGAYFLNRYGWYRLAASAMVMMVPVVALLRVSFGSTPDPAVTLCLLPLSLIFASMLLSIRVTLAVAVIQVLAVACMPWVNRQAFLNYAQYMDVVALNFIASALILIAIRHRDRIEVDRQSELRSKEERFRAFVEQSLVGVALVSQNQIVFINEALSNMFDYPTDEMLLWPVEELLAKLVHPDDLTFVSQRLQKVQAYDKNAISQHTWRGRTRQGDEIWIESYSRHIAYGQDVGYLMMLTDVTSRIQAEEEKIRLAETKLQSEKMQAIGELAGGIAHDLNNQLTGIVGSADMLLHESRTDSRLVTNCENILLSARRSADLIHQLLAFARKGKFTTKLIQLHHLVDEIASLLGRSVDKMIVIESDLQAKRDTVLGDSSLLQNAILNLALNARDAMPQGGKLAFRSQNTSLDEAQCKNIPVQLACGNYIKLIVEDTGVGIAEELQKRIFEPFYSTKPGKGYGMGLAAVWGTIRSHSGWISVDSKPDHGARFTLWLPLAAESASSEIVPKSRESIDSAALRILLVDDEEIVRTTACSMLEMLNHQVTPCASGKEALSFVKNKASQLDLIILDMVMPEMDGKRVYQAIRVLRPDLPILLSSGYSLDREVSMLVDLNSTGFVQKPFRLEELKNNIAQLLNL